MGNEGWVTADESRVSLGDDENVLELDSDDACTILWLNHWLVHFKKMNLMAYQLSLNKAAFLFNVLY